MKTIDVSGLSCPEPVIRTQAALKDLPRGEQLAVLVDTVTARENILRAATSMHCATTVEGNGNQFKLILSKNS